ncbi:hypothetical protein VTP01DRAFT_8435 [Rhizomucor pusillus]|uniref:uncharacterized protein n=1 Tax=Rhizomucor pusillus TaxID=4840 RepID=UPI003742DA92
MYKLALLRVAAALASFVAVSALPVFDTDLAANPFVHEARRLQYYKQPRIALLPPYLSFVRKSAHIHTRIQSFPFLSAQFPW